MGFSFSKKSKVGPIVNTYNLNIDGSNFAVVKYNDYKKLYNKNTNLSYKIKDLSKTLTNLQNSNFECIVCYCKNSDLKKRTKCGHDLCINCYYLIKNRNCPYCNKKI